jgi:hypothetical protein
MQSTASSLMPLSELEQLQARRLELKRKASQVQKQLKQAWRKRANILQKARYLSIGDLRQLLLEKTAAEASVDEPALKVDPSETRALDELAGDSLQTDRP